MPAMWENLSKQHNESVTVDTPILSAAVKARNTPAVVRVSAAFSVSGVLTATIKEGATTVTVDLNEGAALTADSLYFFQVMLQADQELDLQYSVNAIARVLNVDEAYRGLT